MSVKMSNISSCVSFADEIRQSNICLLVSNIHLQSWLLEITKCIGHFLSDKT